MKNILLYARSLQTQLYGLIGIELGKKYRITYLVQNHSEKETLIKMNCQGVFYNIQEFIENNWENDELLLSIDLEKIENDLQISSLWEICYSDRFLPNFDYADSIRLMKLLAALFTKIFQERKPDIFVNEDIAHFASYLIYYYCRKKGAKYLGLSNPRNIGDVKTALVNGPKGNFYHLDREYENEDFNELEIAEGKKFIKTFREKELPPPYLIDGLFSAKKPSFTKSLRSLLSGVVRSLKKPDKSDYMHYFDNRLHLKSSLFFWKYWLQKKYFRSADYEARYYYFPLHYQPEASTLVGAPNYEKQQLAMDLLAKKIPIGTKLYVKEHFSVLGHRQMSFYKALRKYPNVVFIDPFESSHQLIKNSQGVITLTGTAGWEAILYGKPVFVLGNVFYKSFRYSNNINNINDLSQALQNHKTKGVSDCDYEKELLNYIMAYLKSAKPGISYLNSKKVLDQKNILDLSLIIENEL